MSLTELQNKLIWVILVLLVIFTLTIIYNEIREKIKDKKREEISAQQNLVEEKVKVMSENKRPLFYTPKWKE